MALRVHRAPPHGLGAAGGGDHACELRVPRVVREGLGELLRVVLGLLEDAVAQRQHHEVVAGVRVGRVRVQGREVPLARGVVVVRPVGDERAVVEHGGVALVGGEGVERALRRVEVAGLDQERAEQQLRVAPAPKSTARLASLSASTWRPCRSSASASA